MSPAEFIKHARSDKGSGAAYRAAYLVMCDLYAGKPFRVTGHRLIASSQNAANGGGGARYGCCSCGDWHDTQWTELASRVKEAHRGHQWDVWLHEGAGAEAFAAEIRKQQAMAAKVAA